MAEIKEGCGYAAACANAAKMLSQAGIDEAVQEARLLLEYVCRTQRSELYLHPERLLKKEEAERYSELLEGREKRIPLQYLTGVQYFMGLEFAVNEAVLIPRGDTEILVEAALKELHSGMNLLDLCTGSGCILLSLLHYAKGVKGVGCDLSGEALGVAGENAKHMGIEAELYEGDLYAALPESAYHSFDLIVSNPPYIERAEIDKLMPEVAQYEPRLALDGGEDGLDLYRRIVQDAGKWLKAEGRICLEIGCEQAKDVAALLKEQGFEEIEVLKDYARLDRVVCGRLRQQL